MDRLKTYERPAAVRGPKSLVESATDFLARFSYHEGLMGEVGVVSTDAVSDFEAAIAEARGTALCRCGHPAHKHADTGCVDFNSGSCSCMAFRQREEAA